MRLHSIRLRNYRGITDATVDFSDGVTIVEGPNEVGKSSIHEAITHLREDKASSKKASIKDLQPIGVDAGPEVELHLTSGDVEMRYAKRWLRGQSTTLSILRPTPEQLSGDEAHERFAAILAETVDVDLLVALDVAQGESLDQAPMAQISALQSALSESGTEVADHDAFLEKVEAEYAKYFTKSGKRTGEYRGIDDEVAAAEEAHRELIVRSEAMDDLVDRHARATARLESVREQLSEAVEKRDAVEESVSALAALRSALTAAEESAEAVARDLTLANEARERREKLVDDAATASAAVTEASDRARALEADQAEKDEAFSREQARLAEAQKQLGSLRDAAKQTARRLARTRAQGDLAELDRRLGEIRIEDERRSAALATIGSIDVTAADVERLISLETDVRIAEGAKTAAAAQISARRLGEAQIRIGDVDLGENGDEEFAVTSELLIAIDGIAEITVRPGASPVELDRALDAATTALERELERLAVDSVAEAREQAQRRSDAEADAAEAASTLKALLGRDRREDLEARFARAEAVVAGGDSDSGNEEAEVRETGTGADAARASIAELDSALADAEAAVEATQSAVDEAASRLDTARTARDEVRVDAVRAQTSVQETTAQAQRLTQALAEAREAHADEALAAAVAKAGERAQEAAARVVEARAAYEAADPETLEMTVKNLRQLVVSKEAQREADRQEVDGLTAVIDDRAGEGIYEKLSAAEESLESARARQVRLERSARAIEMLRSTVLAHKEEAQRKYVAPFKEQIERLGRLIFGPGLSVEVSEDLEIASRTLGGTTVPFASLSGGTREQLSLIGRLAVASLVDPKAGAPVILDDAFGFADPERLAALNVVLGNVGESAQVILLTCQPERFALVGGATTVSLG
ncbi:AAA family ATPase [Brevibacterium metallidurans]|uniref:ATP-binding protein n=1 Tax=Brevibacterium metallidurans TaxID=1482676 RepID=A0ABN0SS49_9MICO